MPEYLSPGVYTEEVPSRKSIEGVSTTVTGFIGPTRYGPIQGDPELLTSYLDFARIYAGVDQIDFKDVGSMDNYTAHAVRAFFDNGGTKLYVTRIYRANPSDANGGKASATSLFLPASSLPPAPFLVARFAGEAGNMQVTFAVRTSPNLLVGGPSGPVVRGVRANDLVFVKPGTSGSSVSGLYNVIATVGASGATLALSHAPGGPTVQFASLDPTSMRVHRITLSVLALRAGMFETEESWTDLAPDPDARNALTKIFRDQPESREQQLTSPFAINPPFEPFTGANLLVWIFGHDFINGTLSLSLATDQELAAGSLPQTRPAPAALQQMYMLQGGSDGNLPSDTEYEGQPAVRDPATQQSTPATGLESFCDIDEISMVAAPGFSFAYNDNQARADSIVQTLIEHCEIRMKYRIALIDSPDDFIVSEVRTFRGKFDSSYAALYYPWLKIIDPLDPDARREIVVPPSGYVAGICARSDVAHGVSKAPANEVPLGAIDLELTLNKAQQDVLNPLGINCFRFFPDRGIRLWGARMASSDPDWKYTSTRRYFNYCEHSIDKGTQWVVFEKNDEVTWANVRQTVWDFLYNEWKNDALMGTKPEQAFFVRCDRSTMTQNDLDNGRLICLIGIAVIKPAEFVIFRIGQFTADATS
jgi:phage tail sheath protein FI